MYTTAGDRRAVETSSEREMTAMGTRINTDATSARGIGLAGFDVVRILLGLLLLTAAALKGVELASSPVANPGLFTSRWFLVIVVEFELLLGLWLLSGLQPRHTRMTAIALFVSFAAIAAYKGGTGAASCGCFGKVPANPWHTLILDVVSIGALLAFRPTSVPPMSALHHRSRQLTVVAIAVLVGVPAGYLMSSYAPAALADDGVITGPGNLVILEPEQWVGKRLPLLEHIDVGDRLSKGNWIALLYHDGCPDCAEAVPRYRQIDRDLKASGDDLAVAMIEIPPYGTSHNGIRTDRGRPLEGKLNDTKEWFVTTPAVVLLAGGLVQAAWKGHAPSLEILRQHATYVPMALRSPCSRLTTPERVHVAHRPQTDARPQQSPMAHTRLARFALSGWAHGRYRNRW